MMVGTGHLTELRLSIATKADAIAAHVPVSRFCRDHGFTPREVAEIEVIAGELVSNLVVHGCGGVLAVRAVLGPVVGIELVTVDSGPGFEHPEHSRRDGFSRGRCMLTHLMPAQRSSLGIGLGSIERFADRLDIENLPDGGARVRVFKRRAGGHR